MIWPEPPPKEISNLPLSTYVEVAIIGAGIHGAALARELTLRNVSCALIDIGGIGGGTSQWSSQLLHGGIRYIRNCDFRQVREGLEERAVWMNIAPHRCIWKTFWMPHRTLLQGITHRTAIGLYDKIWGRKRKNWPPELKLGKVPTNLFKEDPRTKEGPFRGAVAYADLMTYDRDLTLDLAASSEALKFDFHEVLNFHCTKDLRSVRLKDRRNGLEREIIAKKFVFALGPWTDQALQNWFGESKTRLRLSAGIHLWFDKIPGCEHPWTIMRKNNRVLFVIPRDGYLQVGTTEREVVTGYASIVQEEREYLLNALTEDMPSIPWRELPIQKEETGVRPLVLSSGDTTKISREAKLEKYPKFDNLYLVLGGKLTTARLLMSTLAKQITGQECFESKTYKLTPHQF